MTNEELKRDLSDSEILLLTIIGEARGEPVEGQIAVANVILNRSKIRNMSIKDVCLQKYQFSCWNESDPNRAFLIELANKVLKNHYNFYEEYKQIQWIVDGVISSKVSDNTKGRDHYLTTKLFESDKSPSWAENPKSSVLKIGSHVFLRV